MPEGLLNVLKPPGVTSHDLVDGVRRVVRMKRVGHTGTLDPAAAGVVLMMLGSVTRLSQYLTAATKVYRAEITLGIATDTLDGEGRIVVRRSAAEITEEQVLAELVELTGELMVPPPMHSAVWHQGRRLYEIAREGEEVEVEPRPMTVLRSDLLDFAPGETARVLTEIECAKGTYVRSLAGLLGEALGCGAYLSFLVRTQVGAHCVADSYTLEELAELRREDRLAEAMVPPEQTLGDFTCLPVSAEDARVLASGNVIAAGGGMAPGQLVGVLTPEERILGMCEAIERDGELVIQPRRMLIPYEEL